MVKPQFEVGRTRVGKGGVVRDPADRRDALATVATAAAGLGAAVLGFASSGLPGPKGNRETFLWLAEGGRAGALDAAGIDAAVHAAEPGATDGEPA
jgi:23S rRNA (cytidine1920-2'-O)/16S rRNA (cytidine1409-2'-O)-methyltransferase